MSILPPDNSNGMHATWREVGPYLVLPAVAGLSIVPGFRDLMMKSAQQKGMPLPQITILKGLQEGSKAAPTVGVIVGSQMLMQNGLQKALEGEGKEPALSSMLISSALVGAASAPILAVFNGQTMGWSIKETLMKFSFKQGMAITVQETAFIGGLSAADKLAVVMKNAFGDNVFVEYTAAFASGALGSFAGHPANTALTRWQSGMTVDSFKQSMWGAARKARAVGTLSVLYKFGKDTFLPK